jgi:hypothetical protein
MRSSVWEYKPPTVDLANKRAKLKETRALLTQLTEDIEALQKKVSGEHKATVQDVPPEEEEK